MGRHAVAGRVSSPERRIPPPYVVRTERLTIRCWDPRDAPLLKEALDTSLEHLRPWMPWAMDEPKPLDEKVELLRRFRGQFDLGEDFVYGVFTLVCNLIADLLYGWLDPRVRL